MMISFSILYYLELLTSFSHYGTLDIRDRFGNEVGLRMGLIKFECEVPIEERTFCGTPCVLIGLGGKLSWCGQLKEVHILSNKANKSR